MRWPRLLSEPRARGIRRDKDAVTAARSLASVCLGAATVLACTGASPPATHSPAPPSPAAPSPATQSISEFFAIADREVVSRTPMALGTRGVHEQIDSWDDLSPDAAQETAAIRRRHLEALHNGYELSSLSPEDQLSYRLFEYQWAMELERFEFRFHDYPVNQMRSAHSAVVTHLTNIHRIQSPADADAYIARLRAIPTYLQQLRENIEQQAQRGILAPKFTFPIAIAVGKAVSSGTPLDSGPQENVLYADFRRKVEALKLSPPETRDRLARAEAALRDAMVPAFASFGDFLAGLSQRAKVQGVWALPHGDAYYRSRLKRFTTTDMTPDEIHELGRSEVARLQGEIRKVMARVGFTGSLQEFFRFTLEDPQFYYPNTAAGKAEAVAHATRLVEGFKVELDKLFITKPKADVVVRPVEPYREASTGAAFYRRGSADGSRPGIYYLNTHDTRSIPKWEMAALAYHEAIPGHHMQRSIGQEMDHLPDFRRFVRWEAYTEGWGLYSELVPKEIGYYQDPYDDYGRLAMELRRACRLVADTGLHHRRWSLEQGVAFMVENMPNTKERATKSIQRYLVMPGQATAYKIGQLKILELRTKAERTLGKRFDVRGFHDVVLRSSQVPLSILEDIVDTWVKGQRGWPSSRARHSRSHTKWT